MSEADLPALEAARALVEAGRTGEAGRVLRRLLEADEAEFDPREVALLAERTGDVVVAAMAWNRVRASGGDPEAAAHLVSLARAAGDLQEALRVAREERARDPADSRWIREEVEILLDLGREGEARQVVEDLRHASPQPCALCDELEDLLAGRTAADGIIEEFEEPGTAEGNAAEAVVEPPPAAWSPPDADVVRFLHLFGGREDVHARMWVNAEGRTGYQPVRHPLSARDVRNHLLGNVTLGVYPVRLDGTTRFFAIDLDLRKEALESAAGDPERAQRLREAVRRAAAHVRARLRELGLDALEESSGFKGRHFWVFLDPPAPAGHVHEMGRRLLAFVDPADPDIGLEFFPKQGSRRGRLGNLIKLPLGIHLRTGRRSLLLDEEGRPLADPWERLRSVRPLDPAGFEALVDRLADVGPVSDVTGNAAQNGPGTASARPEEPSLPRPVEAPPWTEADFRLDPPVRALLDGCVIVRRIVETILEGGAASPEVVTSLRATLGHLPRGVHAVNWLFDRAGSVPRDAYLKSRLRGNPVSCQKLRSRFPAWAALDECSCSFEGILASYPSPVLHAEAVPPAGGEDGSPRFDPEHEARRLGWLERRSRELAEELASVRRALVAWMKAHGRHSIELEEGAWVLVQEEGVDGLEWKPSGRDAPGNGSP